MTTDAILVVDDDPDILTVLKGNLELDGYEVITASSGKQALKQFDHQPPDLVVLDLNLPDIDGVQVCRTLRSRTQTPIIMLTARDGLSDKVLGLESGADDYLVKPFDYLELAARIKARLRRRHAYRLVEPTQPAPAPAGSPDALVLDPQTRQVTCNGRCVQLTAKQFDLLSLLVRHAGKLLDRAAIRNALWPKRQLYRWSRAIDVHIQHLRAKIEDNPQSPTLIVTVQGKGYRLDLPPRNSA